jgi:predicted outer membrane repeat protein
MILGAGANITLPPSGAELNPPLTTGGVTLIVRGEDSANPSTLTLGGDGTLLNIGANRTLILENVILQGKAGNTGGPLIKVQSGAVELREGTVITGNTRTGGSGGGVYLDGGSLAVYEGTRISGNHARNGGGIYAQGNASLTVAGVIGGTGTENTAVTLGGGIYLSGGSLNMEGNAAVSNNRMTDSGTSPDGTRGGCGVYIRDGKIVMKGNSVINNNTGSAPWGTGIFIYKNGSLLMKDNAAITGNEAQSGGGVAYYYGVSSIEGENRITGNKSSGRDDNDVKVYQ